jgi:hypothetical protein
MLKRTKGLTRKTPLRANPEKTRAWKDRTRAELPKSGTPMRQRSKKRAKQERKYNADIEKFLAEHPICPVTGSRTTEIHHSAKRFGQWLNLKRYWIALSHDGHRWVEDNKAEAEKIGLMVRIRETYKEHCAILEQDGVNLDEPLYYKSR